MIFCVAARAEARAARLLTAQVDCWPGGAPKQVPETLSQQRLRQMTLPPPTRSSALQPNLRVGDSQAGRKCMATQAASSPSWYAQTARRATCCGWRIPITRIHHMPHSCGGAHLVRSRTCVHGHLRILHTCECLGDRRWHCLAHLHVRHGTYRTRAPQRWSVLRAAY